MHAEHMVCSLGNDSRLQRSSQLAMADDNQQELILATTLPYEVEMKKQPVFRTS